jgi:hypothetical protein
MEKNLENFLHYFVANPKYRIGQAFCNYYNITDPDLFYEENNNKCWNIINEKYSHLMFP